MKHTATIEKYLHKEMTEAEKTNFEALLKNDSELQAEYAFHLHVFQALEKRQMREKIHKNQAKNWVNELEVAEEQKEKTSILPIWSKYAAAACVLLALSLGMYHYVSQEEVRSSIVVRKTDTIPQDTASQIVAAPQTDPETLINKPKKLPSSPTPSPKTREKMEWMDNSRELATLQQIINIKKEIRGYQDSIEAVSSKKIVGFSGTKTEKIEWQTEENVLQQYKKQKNRPSASEIKEWENQKAHLWEELSANKELWNKYKQRK
jgi:hypothetical protein